MKRHVFVCTNERPEKGRPSCSARGSRRLLQALRERLLADPTSWGELAVTGCDCLGPCFDGPNIVVYPEAIWYAGVGEDDVDEIVESHLLGGRPVQRLVYDFDDED